MLSPSGALTAAPPQPGAQAPGCSGEEGAALGALSWRAALLALATRLSVRRRGPRWARPAGHNCDRDKFTQRE